MPNKSLENKIYTCSDEVINHLNSLLPKYQNDETNKGYKRAKSIVNDGNIAYGQMKRIKNYFDNYKGDGEDDEYKLNGGSLMKDWVNKELGTSRDAIHGTKKVQMDAGRENSFIRNHTKDRDNANPTGISIPKLHKGSKMANIMKNDTVYEDINHKIKSQTIYEEIESIKYLINYMDDNNNKKQL